MAEMPASMEVSLVIEPLIGSGGCPTATLPCPLLTPAKLSLCGGALFLVAAAAACNSKPPVGGGGDGGPIVLTDGGQPTGHHDGGIPDSGILMMPDSGPTLLKIFSLAPARGPVAGGTPVTLIGSGFLSGLTPTDPAAAALATKVSFGGNPCLTVTVLSDSSLAVSSPAGSPGPADVTVTNANGTTTCAGCFSFQAVVEIAAVSPARGPLGGGTPVSVQGLGLDATTVLLFGGREALEVAQTSTGLTALTPSASLSGPVDVRAFNANGAALLHAAYTYAATPQVLTVTPPEGPLAGGTAVTVTGSGFLGEAVTVRFGTANALAQVIDDATLAVTTPAVGSAGPVDVEVSDPDGAATLSGGFVYFDPAATTFDLLGVVPNEGPLGGGGSAVLVGTGFPPAGFPVTFGAAAPVTATQTSAHTATLTVPAGADAGPVAVTATGPTASTLADGYTYQASALLTSVTPSSGPSDGGTLVTLVGQGFAPGDQVRFGPLLATNVAVAASGDSLTALTPPGSAGPTDVTLTHPRVDAGLTGGNEARLATLTGGFTYFDPLRLIEVNPASGSQAGGTYVELLGTGFALGTSSTFGAAAATDLQLLDAYTLACHTPPGTVGAVDVTVALPGDAGASTLSAGYSYFDPTNASGGQNGGPLDGTLNVTVLSSSYTYGVPVAGATVRLGLDPQTPFQGQTDANGQITFSDPSLLKAQTVTAVFEGTAATVDDVTQQNLTLFLDIAVGSGGPLPTPCPCSKNGGPPDCPNNCGMPYCSLIGVCVQCLSNSDCANPTLPGYNPQTPLCNPPGGFGGSCVRCITDGDCTNDPKRNLACDNARGTASTFTCVQCTSDQNCAALNNGASYCNTQTVTCENADVVEGTVYGFKLPANLTLEPGQTVEAHVGLLEPSVYDFEPFSPNPQEITVTQEGGAFGFQINQGQLDLSLYAKYGIADSNTGTFTPLLLGVLRGVSVDPQHPATGLTILLDTHLDQSAPIQITNQIAAPPQVFFIGDGGITVSGQPVQYDTFAYLDFGQNGVLPLGDSLTQGQSTTLTHLPAVLGNGVLFLTQAFQNPPPPQPAPDPSQRSPFSVFFRSVSTDFTTGVPIGPLLPFVAPLHPASGAPLDGTFTWSFGGSTPPQAPPDVTRLDVAYVQVDPAGNQTFPTELWQIVVPGSQTSVQLPTDVLASLLQAVPASQPMLQTYVFWQIDTAHAPRFSYNFFSYVDLSLQSWTSFQTTQSLAAP